MSSKQKNIEKYRLFNAFKSDIYKIIVEKSGSTKSILSDQEWVWKLFLIYINTHPFSPKCRTLFGFKEKMIDFFSFEDNKYYNSAIYDQYGLRNTLIAEASSLLIKIEETYRYYCKNYNKIVFDLSNEDLSRQFEEAQKNIEILEQNIKNISYSIKRIKQLKKKVENYSEDE